MPHHLETGLIGEQMADKFLVKKGFTILDKNWRKGHWEIDIIATKDDFLHFIEVKTRRSTQFGHPEESVTKTKLRNLIKAAEVYCSAFPKCKKISFDILSILILDNTPPEYFFIEDVYV